tara:strand:- start:123 stop:1394 length:1272 start_codon:yes stop_codon:yes gene_type:complete
MKKPKITMNLVKVSKILGIDFFNGAIKVSELLDIMDVAEFDPWSKPLSGYQRKLVASKVNQIAERTITNIDSPEVLVDAINLNIRSENARTYVKPINKENDRYGGFHEFSYVRELGSAYLVDGQHRAKGIQRAISILNDDKDTKSLDKLKNTYVNISLTLTEDIFKEAYVFYLINQYAKNVSPEGATRLLVEGYENEKVEFKNEITSGATKQTIDDIESAKIADKLSIDSDVWANRIKDYNEKAADKVSIRAMALMIKPFYLAVTKSSLDSHGTELQPEEITYDLIEVFWTALSKVFPEMFDGVKGKKYGITKSSQAEVLMKVLRVVFILQKDDWRDRGYAFGDLKSIEEWYKVLKTLKTWTDENNANPPKRVKGSDCWLIGTSGSMGKYTSASAKNAIATNLTNHIEKELGIVRMNPNSLMQ